MANVPKVVTPPVFRDPDTTPFVYFDVAPTFGVLSGAIQIEVAARVLRPNPAGAVSSEFVTTGHIRCSPAAAMELREAINRALEMLQQPPETGSGAATLN